MLIMLENFMKTDIYQCADCIELFDKNGNEIDVDPEWVKATQILEYHLSREQIGLLEIWLNI